MTNTIRQLEKKAAVEAVCKAMQLCVSVQNKIVSAGTDGQSGITKSDASPVTIADFGAQALVNSVLVEYFPDFVMVGEEDASDLRSNAVLRSYMMEELATVDSTLQAETVLSLIDRGNYAGGSTGKHWTLDPIDGTKGFLRGEQYAIALALIEEGQVVLGVLGCPNLPMPSGETGNEEKGAVFVAVQGEKVEILNRHGAHHGYASVKHISSIAEANFCESVESSHSSHSESAAIAKALGITKEPYRMDSQCKYAAVARGDASIYLRLPTKKSYQEKIWDHAAGVCVIENAGGMVTDIHGKKLDFSLGRTLAQNSGVVVSNGQFHDAIIKAIQQTIV